MSTVFVIAEADARLLCKAFNSPTASSCSVPQLEKKLRRIPDFLASHNGEAVAITNDVPKKLKPKLDELLDVFTKDTKAKITIKSSSVSLDDDDTDAVEVSAKSKPSPKKEKTVKTKTQKPVKATKKPVKATKKPVKSEKAAESNGKPKAERKERAQRMDTSQMKILLMIAKNPAISKEKIEAKLEAAGVEASEWTIIWARQAWQQVMAALEAVGKVVK